MILLDINGQKFPNTTSIERSYLPVYMYAFM